MATTTKLKDFTPAAEEALRRGISRERMVRLIQCGQVPGERIGSNWFVHTRPGVANDQPNQAA